MGANMSQTSHYYETRINELDLKVKGISKAMPVID